MTNLCPTCNNAIDKKPLDGLGEDVLGCRVCRRFSVEGSSTWLTAPSLSDLLKLVKRRDDDKRRDKEMITSPISDPRWTQIYL